MNKMSNLILDITIGVKTDLPDEKVRDLVEDFAGLGCIYEDHLYDEGLFKPSYVDVHGFKPLEHIYNLFLTKVISAEEFTDLVKRVYQNVRNHYYGK